MGAAAFPVFLLLRQLQRGDYYEFHPPFGPGRQPRAAGQPAALLRIHRHHPGFPGGFPGGYYPVPSTGLLLPQLRQPVLQPSPAGKLHGTAGPSAHRLPGFGSLPHRGPSRVGQRPSGCRLRRPLPGEAPGVRSGFRPSVHRRERALPTAGHLVPACPATRWNSPSRRFPLPKTDAT